MIIGLGYKKGSGKDTVADFLVRNHGFTKLSFADPLKAAAREIFGFDQEQLYGSKKEELDPFWKDTPRNVLQKVGTDCLRKGYRDDIWIKALLRKIEPGKDYVIPDVRFPNEAHAVKNAGGHLWRIDRATGPAVDTHESETAMDSFEGWGRTIYNHGTISDMLYVVDGLVSRSRVL